MRRPFLAAFALLGVLLGLAPLASAELLLADVDVYDSETERLLTRVPLDQPVLFKVRVENEGPGDFNGTVELKLVITDPAGTVVLNTTAARTVSLTEGESDNVTLAWKASALGEHTLDVTFVDGTDTPFQLRYIVAESSVPRGSLVERLIDYWWFYAGFVGIVVLFVAVVRTRKPGP